MNEQTNKAVAILLVISIALVVIAMIIAPTPNPPTPTVTPTITPSITPTVVLPPTPTDTPTATPTTGFTHQCLNYYQMCVPVGTPGPSGSIPDPLGQCQIGKACWRYPDVTPTVAAIGTPTVTPTKLPTVIVTGQHPTYGGYQQYSWPCHYPLETARLPDGTLMELCPNGLSYSTNPPSYKNSFAFLTAGGADWLKHNKALGKDFIPLGDIVWISWKEINPSEGQYNWSIIDKYIAAANQLQMETPSGLAPKDVIIRLYDFTSTRPAEAAPLSGIDGGFIFDDMTPDYVKRRLVGSVSWGGPIKNGVKIGQDSGSYWVRTSCVYQDYVASKPQGSAWSYAIFVMPKYDRVEWQEAARKMLRDVGAHYNGTGINIMLGLNGLDGESGNWLPGSFAGCDNLQQLAVAQYKLGNVYLKDMVQTWRGVNQDATWVSCTAGCDPNWFYGQGVGLFQARAIYDSPDMHRAGEIGWLDWALRWDGPVAFENALSFGTTEQMYRMLSVVSIAWPKFFSFVGGTYAGNNDIIRPFIQSLGETITTTKSVSWKAFTTCYQVPHPYLCQDDKRSQSDDWTQYMGWVGNLERGISTTVTLAHVDPWKELTAEQQVGNYWHMVRRLPVGSTTFNIDQLWGSKNGKDYSLYIIFLDNVNTTITVSYKKADGAMGVVVVPTQNNNKWSKITLDLPNSTFETGEISVGVKGNDLILHGLEILAR